MNTAPIDGGVRTLDEPDGMGIEEELWVKEIQPLFIKGWTPAEISWETGTDEFLVEDIIERRSKPQPVRPKADLAAIPVSSQSSWALKMGLRCSQVAAIVVRCLRRDDIDQ